LKLNNCLSNDGIMEHHLKERLPKTGETWCE
jgi:hypothetical protein